MSEWNFNPQVTRTRVFSNFLFQILCFKNQIQVCELKFRESEIFHGQYSRWPVHLCLVPWAAGDWGSFLGWLSTKHDPFFPRLCWCPILSQIYLYTQSTVYMYICMYIYIILYYIITYCWYATYCWWFFLLLLMGPCYSLVASHAPDGRIGASARSPWKEPVTGSDATRDFCKGYMSMYTKHTISI